MTNPRRAWLRVLAVPIALALAVGACTTHTGSYETARLTGMARSGGRRLRVVIRAGRVTETSGGEAQLISAASGVAGSSMVELGRGESVALVVVSDVDGVVDAGDLAPQQAVEADRSSVVWLVGARPGVHLVEFFPPELCVLRVCVA